MLLREIAQQGHTVPQTASARDAIRGIVWPLHVGSIAWGVVERGPHGLRTRGEDGFCGRVGVAVGTIGTVGSRGFWRDGARINFEVGDGWFWGVVGRIIFGCGERQGARDAWDSCDT